MPTYEFLARFYAEFTRLSPTQQAAFLLAVAHFVADLKAGEGFRKGLRVKGVRGAGGVFEMTWAPDGRATFEYARSLGENEPHILWRRIGTHDILDQP